MKTSRKMEECEEGAHGNPEDGQPTKEKSVNKKKVNKYLQQAVERSQASLGKVQDSVAKVYSTSINVARSSSHKFTKAFKSKLKKRFTGIRNAKDGKTDQSACGSSSDEEGDSRSESDSVCQGALSNESLEDVVDSVKPVEKNKNESDELGKVQTRVLKMSKGRKLLLQMRHRKRVPSEDIDKRSSETSLTHEYEFINEDLLAEQTYETTPISQKAPENEYVDMTAVAEEEYVPMKLVYGNINQNVEVDKELVGSPLKADSEFPNEVVNTLQRQNRFINQAAQVRPRLVTPVEKERMLVPDANIECEDFYERSVEDLSECLKSCGFTALAELCDQECLDGEFFRNIDRTKLMEEPFSLNGFHINKLVKVIGGWRPKRSASNASYANLLSLE